MAGSFWRLAGVILLPLIAAWIASESHREVTLEDPAPSGNWPGVLGLSVGVSIALLVAGVLTRRLNRMSRVVEAFARGDYSRHIPSTSSDVLDRFGRVMNTMADQINQDSGKLDQTDDLRRGLINGFSHDLRTPLSSIRGYAETMLLKDGTLEKHEKREYLQLIVDNADRLNSLMQDLFELAKLESGQTQVHQQPFSVVNALDLLVSQLGPVVQKRGVHLARTCGNNIPEVSADGDLIGRALQNLLGEVISLMKEGGSIVLSIDSEEHRVNVSIECTGIRLAGSDLSFAFDRRDHTQTSASFGPRIEIVRKIMEAHGERVTLQTGSRDVARFTFGLLCANVNESAAA